MRTAATPPPLDFRPAYHWLRRVQSEVVPQASGRSLLWGYANWSMTRWEWNRISPRDEVLLTLRLPLERCLFTDLDNWWWVYAYSFYTADADHTDACWGPPRPPCTACDAADEFYEPADASTPAWRRDYRQLPTHLRTRLEDTWRQAAFTFSGGAVQATFEYVDISEVVRALPVASATPPPPRDAATLRYTTAARINHAPPSPPPPHDGWPAPLQTSHSFQVSPPARARPPQSPAFRRAVEEARDTTAN